MLVTLEPMMTDDGYWKLDDDDNDNDGDGDDGNNVR